MCSGSEIASRVSGQEDLLFECRKRGRSGSETAIRVSQKKTCCQNCRYETGTEYGKNRPASVHRVLPRSQCMEPGRNKARTVPLTYIECHQRSHVRNRDGTSQIPSRKHTYQAQSLLFTSQPESISESGAEYMSESLQTCTAICSTPL